LSYLFRGQKRILKDEIYRIKISLRFAAFIFQLESTIRNASMVSLTCYK